MAKVEDELDAAGLLKTADNPKPRQFTYADIGKLHYLDCCIKVWLRITMRVDACLQRFHRLAARSHGGVHVLTSAHSASTRVPGLVCDHSLPSD